MAQGHWVIMFPERHAHPRAAARACTRSGGTRLAIATDTPVVPIRNHLGALLAAQELLLRPARRHLHRPADRHRAEPDEMMREVGGLDRGRDAPPRPRGLHRGGARRRP